ncbi:uncharacterized protein BYT42DRAFT_332905 [Radiomyces spectabilis]|uniref:uncharacterized protein n=1 Tax=Radiomyces spectabilis TaxID=64574 RepID=UPI00221F81A6|nr:uncharacterized protein BYT42DRAFT_332905 [Radiomyces spectabilis]KAI8379600.1 hypothetical protein BYT42DRAFT_332905 [Radiomyces spectabilis]
MMMMMMMDRPLSVFALILYLSISATAPRVMEFLDFLEVWIFFSFTDDVYSQAVYREIAHASKKKKKMETRMFIAFDEIHSGSFFSCR